MLFYGAFGGIGGENEGASVSPAAPGRRDCTRGPPNEWPSSATSTFSTSAAHLTCSKFQSGQARVRN